MVSPFNVHKSHSLFFPCGQARQRLLHIQLFQRAVLLLKQRAETDCFLQVGAAAAQTFQLLAHALSQRALPFQHLPDLCQRHVQLAQQLDAAQALHIRLRVAAVAVARLPAGTDEPLLLVKADVLFGHADGGFHFVDLHGSRPPPYGSILHLPQRGRSSLFAKRAAAQGRTAAPSFKNST